MFFKDAKNGCAVYLFDRNEATVKQGVITNVTFPKLSAQQNMGMTVDVTISCEGSSRVYEVKDTADNAFVGTLMITPNMENLANEIRGLKTQNEEILNSIDARRKTVERCEELLKEYDPVFKEKRMTDERFGRIESSIDKLTELVTKMVENRTN